MPPDGCLLIDDDISLMMPYAGAMPAPDVQCRASERVERERRYYLCRAFDEVIAEPSPYAALMMRDTMPRCCRYLSADMARDEARCTHERYDEERAMPQMLCVVMRAWCAQSMMMRTPMSQRTREQSGRCSGHSTPSGM